MVLGPLLVRGANLYGLGPLLGRRANFYGIGSPVSKESQLLWYWLSC